MQLRIDTAKSRQECSLPSIRSEENILSNRNSRNALPLPQIEPMSADMAQCITVEDCSVQSISPTKPKTQSNGPPLVINILYTQYEIIHEVAQECNF
jgi:hypothetical protein